MDLWEVKFLKPRDVYPRRRVPFHIELNEGPNGLSVLITYCYWYKFFNNLTTGDTYYYEYED